jgi:hypothetical protein
MTIEGVGEISNLADALSVFRIGFFAGVTERLARRAISLLI